MAPAGSASRWTNQIELVTWVLMHWQTAGLGLAKAALAAALGGKELLIPTEVEALRILFTIAAPR
jgi:hypothetical protein